ncbi:MgtC/SapB family protein [Peloplasma aerotolerans]|uniref:MgtC/SapB family protein n=1 Tax=Peloplasma aerotolerans TaxID=3044389 RepID=A0AAW6U7X5_9MOLU|nr:MgtC/SapB family protein [Mariniplasma sp. M4Ah]MDI6452186.1 MgtC/SapB family protein [Mariniplasma sp. M4Ah]MDR4968326.1 MgtC/SapB family protein [Acholeplasmataceae bacterium]
MILDANLTLTDIILKVILPLALTFFVAAFVGLERQNVGKAAGLSSHILVAMASAGIAVMQRLMFEQQISAGFSDPEQQRVIAQVITGVGFVGAGVIIKDQANVVKGITTAATIWFTAMIGLILGSGYLVVGTILGVFIVIFVLSRDIARGFNPLKPKANREHTHSRDGE